MVDAGKKARCDHFRCGGERAPMAEADLQNLIVRAQFEQVEGDSVRHGCLMCHDAPDDLAQQTTGSPALASDEFWTAHLNALLAGVPRSGLASKLGRRRRWSSRSRSSVR